MWTVLAYVLVTFGFAVVWHLLWFRSFYDRIGYFGEQEGFNIACIYEVETLIDAHSQYLGAGCHRIP